MSEIRSAGWYPDPQVNSSRWWGGAGLDGQPLAPGPAAARPPPALAAVKIPDDDRWDGYLPWLFAGIDALMTLPSLFTLARSVAGLRAGGPR